MTHALFDTLEYVRLLKQVNFEQNQAEGLGKAQMMVSKSLLTHTATQNDLIIMTTNLRTEMHQIRDELRKEMHKLRDDLRKDMHQLFINNVIINLTFMGIILGAMAYMLK